MAAFFGVYAGVYAGSYAMGVQITARKSDCQPNLVGKDQQTHAFGMLAVAVFLVSNSASLEGKAKY